MDEGLFIMVLICGFLIFFALIYCFLSTCLGVQIRRSDIWEALKPPSTADVRRRDAERSKRRGMAEEFELDEVVYSDGREGVIERMQGGGGGGMEDWEMMKARTGMGRRGLF